MPPPLTPTDLGLLPGGTFSVALGCNVDGTVVVGVANDVSGFGHAFRWTLAGGMIDLGLLGGGSFSLARACSDDGNTIVGEGDTGSGNSEAFVCNFPGGLTGLGTLGGDDTSGAYCVSADGSIIGGFSEDSINGLAKPVIWPGPSAVGLLGGNLAGITAGMDAAGLTIMGGTNNNADQPWQASGGAPGPVGLPPGQASGGMSAVNSDGSVGVGTALTPSNGQPFITPSTAIPIPFGFDYGFAQSVDGAGVGVVGSFGLFPGQLSQAFYFSSGTGVIFFNALIPADPTRANGISRNGFAAVGSSGGTQRAVLWGASSPPPTPGFNPTVKTVRALRLGPALLQVCCTPGSLQNVRRFPTASGTR